MRLEDLMLEWNARLAVLLCLACLVAVAAGNFGWGPLNFGW